MDAVAVILEAPEQLSLRSLALNEPTASDIVVEIAWSGISTGTERLLWSGKMPEFPGMGYPLVPGYESVGRVVDAGADTRSRIGEWVFVPGANCYQSARGLFGGSASRVVLPGARAIPVAESLGARGVLVALAATAFHAIAGNVLPDLIVGHGVLGRLLARIATATGAPPTVWETSAARLSGADGYQVIDPQADDRRDYKAIYDASGDGALLDDLIGRLARGGEVVLAGFYDKPLNFNFPPAFMREAKLRIAAEFRAEDLEAVTDMVASDALSLDNLITHSRPAAQAADAYPVAFSDTGCLKMVLDWNNL
jgi:bacteriochlorophyllide a dehydrogenase